MSYICIICKLTEDIERHNIPPIHKILIALSVANRQYLLSNCRKTSVKEINTDNKRLEFFESHMTQ